MLRFTSPRHGGPLLAAGMRPEGPETAHARGQEVLTAATASATEYTGVSQSWVSVTRPLTTSKNRR